MSHLRPIPLNSFFLPLLAHGALSFAVAAEPPPTSTQPGVEISLFADHPEIVTPTGIAVDQHGRVFVIENHTHFRPENYQGPSADRIVVFEDVDGDGASDRRTVFYEGLVWGTDLAFSPDGWLYASTRSEIYRMRDTDGDGVADDIHGVVQLETEATYPHNGISGICFPPGSSNQQDVLHFGLGENFGLAYTLAGPDGSRISGGGEGGSIYRCRTSSAALSALGGATESSSKKSARALERIATGVWNPFGMGFDTAGNLFATDNDPDSSPPCRLLHVVDGADFGFEYRYGRTGMHPLVTWTGEFPGTVGMVTGTGEAPGGVISFGPFRLLVASWADHRIELYHLGRLGASFNAVRSTFIQGANQFRPVDLAVAPDGLTYYVTDWVSSSYSLHGQGRIWRFKIPSPHPATTIPPHPDIARTKAIRNMNEAGHIPGLLQLLDEPDPYIRSAAILTLSQLGKPLLRDFSPSLIESPRQRAGVLVALKKSRLPAAEETIPLFIDDDDEDVRFSAVKWIADDKLESHRPLLEKELHRPDISTRMFLATMAALDRLDGKKPRDIPAPADLLKLIAKDNAPNSLRAMAMRLIPPHDEKFTLATLKPFLAHPDPRLRLEAVRSLRHHPDEDRGAFLAAIARNSEQPVALRAEAVGGLALLAETYPGLLAEIADGENPVLRDEALRSLAGVPSVTTKAKRNPAPKPDPTALDEWKTLLGDEIGNPENGRRIFFHQKIGTCSRCHQIEGRGIRVGPDLTTIWKRATNPLNEDAGNSLASWLLESILLPNNTVAPQFLPWEVTNQNGTTRIGLPLRKGGNAESYLGLDGKEFSLTEAEISSHRELQASIMPPDLLEAMTVEEIRDLLAYLTTPK